MKLQILPLSQETFGVYDDVIRIQQWDLFHINDGLAERCHSLALVEILEQDHTLISINRVQPANLPLTIYELERHPLGTQASIPMKSKVFVVVVALDDDKLGLSTLWTFITNGKQGVNYYRSTWHHPFFAWQRVTDFLAADHGGSDSCDVESIPEWELYFAWHLQPTCIR